MAARIARSFEPARTPEVETLSRKVEYLIFSALIHYQTRCEESFLGWNADLELILPELMARPNIVRNTFMRLANQGAIILRVPHTQPKARCACADNGDHLLCGCPLITVLTPEGLMYWHDLRVMVSADSIRIIRMLNG